MHGLSGIATSGDGCAIPLAVMFGAAKSPRGFICEHILIPGVHNPNASKRAIEMVKVFSASGVSLHRYG